MLELCDKRVSNSVLMICTSVVTVAGICNSVGGCFLTCHRGGGAGGEYRSVSRLELLTGNKWMSWLQDRSTRS